MPGLAYNPLTQVLLVTGHVISVSIGQRHGGCSHCNLLQVLTLGFWLLRLQEAGWTDAKANVCTSSRAGWELALLSSAAVIIFQQVCGCSACGAWFESPAGAWGDGGQADPGARWCLPKAQGGVVCPMCSNCILTGLGKRKDSIPDKGPDRDVSEIVVQD